MDDLDVRILRALSSSDPSTAPLSTHTKASLTAIARKLGIDDMTLSNRIKRLREKGLVPALRVIPNPGLFGYRMKSLIIDMPKSLKDDAVRKLRLVHGIVVLVDYYGDTLGIVLFYDTDDSLARTVELISRITNAEKVTQIPMLFPRSEAKRLTSTDWSIIQAIQNDASKSAETVAKELGLTSRTVRGRLEKLQRERTLMFTGNSNTSVVEGISAALFYTYIRSDAKSSVDEAMLSHFDGNYLWARLTDSGVSYLVLVFPSMRVVRQSLMWAKQQPGVGGARMEVVVDTIDLWDTARELFSRPPTQFAEIT